MQHSVAANGMMFRCAHALSARGPTTTSAQLRLAKRTYLPCVENASTLYPLNRMRLSKFWQTLRQGQLWKALLSQMMKPVTQSQMLVQMLTKTQSRHWASRPPISMPKVAKRSPRQARHTHSCCLGTLLQSSCHSRVMANAFFHSARASVVAIKSQLTSSQLGFFGKSVHALKSRIQSLPV